MPANIVTVLGTSNISAQLKPSVSQQIAVINKWTDTPLTSYLFKADIMNSAISAKSGTKAPKTALTIDKVGNRTYKDFEDELPARSTTVHDSAGGTAVGSATASNNTLIVNDATIFRKGDIISIHVPSTNVKREEAYVKSVNYSTNTLTLERSTTLNGAALSSAIALSDVVRLITTAFAEGSTYATSIFSVKTEVTNYVQNFKDAWTLTEQLEKSELWTQNEPEHQKLMALKRLYENFDAAMWLGRPGFEAATDEDGKKVTKTGGILHGIVNGGGYSVDAGTNVTKDELDAMIKYTFSNYGGSNKGYILACSAEGVSDIEAMVTASGAGYTMNMNAGDTSTLGVSINAYKTSFTPEGGIPIIHIPTFNRLGVKGIVLLNLDTIKLAEFIPFRAEEIPANGVQEKKMQVLGEYGLRRVMFKTNGYLKITGSSYAHN